MPDDLDSMHYDEVVAYLRRLDAIYDERREQQRQQAGG